RRLALLFGARTRRHLHRPGPNGARAALRHPSPGGEVGALALRGASRQRSARLPRVTEANRNSAGTCTDTFARFRSDLSRRDSFLNDRSANAKTPAARIRRP